MRAGKSIGPALVESVEALSAADQPRRLVMYAYILLLRLPFEAEAPRSDGSGSLLVASLCILQTQY